MLTQKLALSYFSKIVLQFVQMITSIVVARIVGPDVLGVLAYGLAFVSMFAFTADLGTGTAYIKLYSEGYNKEKCLGTYVRIRLSLVALFTLTVMISYFGKKGYRFDLNAFSTQDYVVLIYLLITIVGLIYSTFTATWIARTEQAKTDIPQLIQTFLYQIFRLVIALLGFRAIAIATSNLIAVILVAPMYFYLGRDLKIGEFDRDLALKMIKISIPVILIIAFQALFNSTDRVILKQYTNLTEVGYYSAAFALASFIKGIESSAGLIFFPFFSKAISENNFDTLNNSMRKFEIFSFSFILPFVAIISIMADKVILITYGKEYLPAAGILSVVLPAFFISLVLLPYGNVIAGKGRFYLGAIFWGISFLSYGFIAYFWVRHEMVLQKGQGMGISILIGTLVLSICYFISSKKIVPELKVLPARKALIYSLLYSFFMFIPYHTWVKEAKITINIIFIFLFLLIYLLFGYILKIIRKNEYALILNVININKMKKYLKNELLTKKSRN